MAIAQPQVQPHPAYVTFSAEVNEKTVQNLLTIMGNCAAQNFTEVRLLISTQGGSVMHGINAYNVLLGMPFKLVTHNAGNVDSIGNAIFLAGQERLACPHSTFMFHGAAFNGGNAIFDAKATKERLDSLKADQARISSIITSRSSLTASVVAGYFRGAKVLTAQDALHHGVATGVQDIAIPTGAPVVVVNS